MRTRALLVPLFAAALLIACTSSAPTVEPDATSGPSAPATPPGSAPAACEGAVQLSITLDPGTLRFTAAAHNTTPAPIDLQLPDRCPSGPIHFTGLPGSYDVYGTCAMGACAPHPPTYTLTLPPGATTTLATGAITEGPCNTPLPPGRYTLAFALPNGATTATVCPPTPVTLDR